MFRIMQDSSESNPKYIGHSKKTGQNQKLETVVEDNESRAKGIESLKEVDEFGWNDLHRAAAKGQTDVVVELLKMGQYIDATDQKNCTALHIAAEKGHEDIIKILINAGAEVNALNKEGRTPMEVAQIHHNFHIIKLIDEHTRSIRDKKFQPNNETLQLNERKSLDPQTLKNNAIQNIQANLKKSHCCSIL